MVRAIRENVEVQPGGIIHIHRPDLPAGRMAEVIVLLDDQAGEGKNGAEPRPPLTAYFDKVKGCFKDANEADRFIRQERDSWDR